MIPIYLAAPWKDRDLAAIVARDLVSAGFTITEPWWNHPDTNDPTELRLQAKKDLFGVRTADYLICLNTLKSEGKAVETGYALAFNVPVVIVGPITSIFHHHPLVTVVSTVEEAINVIRRQG